MSDLVILDDPNEKIIVGEKEMDVLSSLFPKAESLTYYANILHYSQNFIALSSLKLPDLRSIMNNRGIKNPPSSSRKKDDLLNLLYRRLVYTQKILSLEEKQKICSNYVGVIRCDNNKWLVEIDGQLYGLHDDVKYAVIVHDTIAYHIDCNKKRCNNPDSNYDIDQNIIRDRIPVPMYDFIKKNFVRVGDFFDLI